MNVVYDYLKSINVDLDYESCQPVSGDSDDSFDNDSSSSGD